MKVLFQGNTARMRIHVSGFSNQPDHVVRFSGDHPCLQIFCQLMSDSASTQYQILWSPLLPHLLSRLMSVWLITRNEKLTDCNPSKWGNAYQHLGIFNSYQLYFSSLPITFPRGNAVQPTHTVGKSQNKRCQIHPSDVQSIQVMSNPSIT